MKLAHECSAELPQEELIKYIPAEGIISHLRRAFRHSCLISHRHPFALAVFKSTAAISDERIRHLRNNYYMIYPFSVFRIYIRRMFMIDLISSMPLDFFLHFVHSDIMGDTTMFYIQMLSLIKVFRVKTLFSYLNNLFARHTMSLFLTKVLKLLLTLALYIQWNCCLQYLIPLAVNIETDPRKRKGSWLDELDLWETSKGQKYIYCLFRALVLLFCTGYGHSVPKTAEDITFVMISLILGSIIKIIMIGYVLQLTKIVNASAVRYKEMLVQLREYMRHKQIPTDLQQRLVDYYEFQFQKTYFRETEILNTLSGQLRQEVILHSCQHLMENVTFFNNLPMDLLVRIATCLHFEIYLVNDVIVKSGTIGDSMFFIATGSVAVYNPMGSEVCHLEEGDHFGEIALLMEGDLRTASVVAVEPCEVFRLDHNDFQRIVSLYPDLLRGVKQTAIERMGETAIG